MPGKLVTNTLLTTINAIENGHVFLGGFQDARLNKDLLRQNALEVCACFEGITANFWLSELSGYDQGAEFNLKARIPQSMEWVQRRSTRRVRIPIKLPVKIQYHNQADCFDVADISIASLSYIVQTEGKYLELSGRLHKHCNIILPDKSIHIANLEIVNNTAILCKNTVNTSRIGCKIKEASFRLDSALQRLINQIDLYPRKRD